MASKNAKGNQSQTFIEKARELGCDESESAFDKRLKRIAQAQPPQKPKPKPKKRTPAK